MELGYGSVAAVGLEGGCLINDQIQRFGDGGQLKALTAHFAAQCLRAVGGRGIGQQEGQAAPVGPCVHEHAHGINIRLLAALVVPEYFRCDIFDLVGGDLQVFVRQCLAKSHIAVLVQADVCGIHAAVEGQRGRFQCRAYAVDEGDELLGGQSGQAFAYGMGFHELVCFRHRESLHRLLYL